MNTEKAKQFAADWIKAWNDHDIKAILSHYADELEFYSPLVLLLKFNETGVITNQTDLEQYFKSGLNSYPDLFFQFHHFFVGINTLVLYYTSVKGRLAAEVFELNEAGRAVKVYCNYSSINSK